MNNNIVWQPSTITRKQRETHNQHNSVVIWFTGLSGSGKTTLANALETHLHEMKCCTYVLDGDNVRHGLCDDLGFSTEDRTENIRRVGEVAKLVMDAGVIVLTAFISPIRKDREQVRKLFEGKDFIEVYVNCSLDVCEQRDVKGLYERARAGEIKEFTGISSPYEEPIIPELVVDTDKHSIEECVQQVMVLLDERDLIW